MPSEEKADNEKKEKEKEKDKEKEREEHPTPAALMEERLLRSIPSDEVRIPQQPSSPPFGLPIGPPDEDSPVPSVRTSTPRCHNAAFQRHYSTLYSLLSCMPILRLVHGNGNACNTV